MDQVIEHDLNRGVFAGEVLSHQLFDRRGARPFGQLLGDPFDQFDELGVLRDRSAFAEDFDHRGDAVGALIDCDAAGFGFTVGALFHRFLTGFADNLDSLLLVAVGFHERFLAFHHRKAGLVAELFNHCGGNFSHDI